MTAKMRSAPAAAASRVFRSAAQTPLSSRGTPSAAAVSSDAKYRVTCSSASTDTGWATMPLLF